MERKFFDDLGSGYVRISRPRFIEEHKNLVKVLKSNDPKQLSAEAKEQSAELKKELKKKTK